jgi:hypothetical protein
MGVKTGECIGEASVSLIPGLAPAEGALLCSQPFVDQAFRRHRWAFSEKRKTGARRLRGDWKGMCAVRDVSQG